MKRNAEDGENAEEDGEEEMGVGFFPRVTVLLLRFTRFAFFTTRGRDAHAP